MKTTTPTHRLIAVFLTLNFLTSLVPVNLLYASNNGPSVPEAAGFEPFDASDMVNLSTGDLSYVLPLLEVPGPEGGYPISMSYHAGITPDMEASWAGLGWYLNPGAINRSLTGTPDDWKGGQSINFISFSKSETFYSVNVDVGFEGGASVGVGMSWGGNKGLSGSVSAGALGMFADVSTDGTISGGFGIGIPDKDSPLRIGASASYNLNSGKGGYGINAYVSPELNSKGNYSTRAYTGISLNSNGGLSVSGGVGFSNKEGANTRAGGSINSSSFSSGDYSVEQDSWGVSLPFHYVGLPLTLGFRKRKVTYSLRKGYNHREWGALYSWDMPNISQNNTNPVGSLDTEFNDYQDRFYTMDMYEQPLPQNEEDFITDVSANNERINFAYLGYDSYNVAAPGVSGNLSPRMFQNITLMGKGDNRGSAADGKKLHIFHHRGNGEVAQRRFGDNNTPNDLHFYFDGQYADQETVVPSTINNSIGSSLSNYIMGGGHTNPNDRATTPSFVEVFTNAEVADGWAQASGLLLTESYDANIRGDQQRFPQEGIGAYKITSPDGKTYHFTLPVYHYEQVQRTLLLENENPSNNNARHVNEKRQYSPYATHWLLTAITGPDYVDTNGDGIPNEADYGYWTLLEYGQWSEGFVWRTPWEDHVQNYNTDLASEIGEDDFGQYMFGRKQLYYLDKIKTRTHSAIFVKDIRMDGVGKDLNYRFDNANGSGYNELYASGGNQGFNQTNPIDVKETNVYYPREYVLKLDRIVLLRNEVANQLSKVSAGNLGTGFSGYSPDDTHQPGWRSLDYGQVYGSNYSYGLHQESQVFDVNDLSSSFIATHAQKVVVLNTDYALAKNSYSSINVAGGNPSLGRLSLRSVSFKGKGGQGIMPDVRYSYYMEEVPNMSFDFASGRSRQALVQDYAKIREQQVDEWGFFAGEVNGQGKCKAWSLKQIDLPTGANITIDYEKDTYWTEAFARRYWQDDLKIAVAYDPSQDWGYVGNFRGYRDYQIFIQNDNASYRNNYVDFSKYFTVGEEVYFDLWICKIEDYSIGGGEDRNHIRIPGSILEVPDEVADLHPDPVILPMTVLDILPDNTLVLSFKLAHNWNNHFQLGPGGGVDYSPISTNFTNPNYFAKRDDQGSPRFRNKPKGQCHNEGGGQTAHTMTYKLLANKIPEDETGGGLRVDRLITSSENGTYITDYDYNVPIGLPNAGRSSGITSYAPVDGLKYVPYQTELPPPGVMYEYVTMTNKDIDGRPHSSVRYRFNTLKQVFDIFNPNMEMPAVGQGSTEDPIFWANVTEAIAPGANVKGVEAKEVALHINTGAVGQLRSITYLNNAGHLLSKTDHFYTNGTQLIDDGRGAITESFQNMKTIFRTNDEGTNIQYNQTKRKLSVSSRTEYSNALKRKVVRSGGQQTETRYSDIDPLLGTYLTSETKRSDGTWRRERRYPAYHFYPEMGPKSDDPNNANMLTQEGMILTDVGIPDAYSSTSASVTTWSNSTRYTDSDVLATGQPWRKHRSYVWRGAQAANGTFGQVLDGNDFNWGSTTQQSSWLKTSQINRYTHWSAPVEFEDINQNLAATKIGQQNGRVYATGNAGYQELFYCGAELFEATGSMGVGVGTATEWSNPADVHTGTHSLRINQGEQGYVLMASEGKTDNYKASLWAKKGTHQNVVLNVGGLSAPVTASPYEMVEAGNWVQLNFYFKIQGTQQISVGSTSNAVFVDDFRVHPVTTNIVSYVYNNWGELTHVLGANNMGTEYRYDLEGRLEEVLSEVQDLSPTQPGGFKRINTYEYTYKNQQP
ncbi:MAG: hypothetical protein AAGF77_06940 [Bacteroidota bacterium]